MSRAKTDRDDAQIIPLDRQHDDERWHDNGGEQPTEPQEEPRPPTFSDEALALRFAKIHADDLRYVAAWNKWLAWDGTRWVFDTTLAAWDEARKICRAAAAECAGCR